MLFLLFGNKVVRKEAGSIDRTCPYCGVPGPHIRMEADNYFTVYFIPLFRVGRAAEDEMVKCRSCRRLFPLQLPVVSAAPPPPPPSTSTWTCRTCANVNPGNAALCLKCKATPTLI